MAGNLFIQYGALGILAGVMFIIIPKFFNKVLKVVENNTAAFTEVKGSLDNLSSSINSLNGNQNKLADTVIKGIHDQATIGTLQCDALKNINKDIRKFEKELKKCPKRKKKTRKKKS